MAAMGYPIAPEAMIGTDTLTGRRPIEQSELDRARQAHEEAVKGYLKLEKWHLTLTGRVPSKQVKYDMYGAAYRLLTILGVSRDLHPRTMPQVRQVLVDAAHLLNGNG